MINKTVTLAAIQMQSDFGETARNLERATRFVEQAASGGAKVILFPELMPGGYMLTEQLWNTAERRGAQTECWLMEMGGRYDAYIGTTFLEADGDDFYNTFLLATPEGSVAGRVRKRPPASFEAYFCRSGDDLPYIDTDLGRMGVGICYENVLYARCKAFFDASVDLILQPSASATFEAKFPIRQKDVDATEALMKIAASSYSAHMGVPVAFANRCGPLSTALPGGFPSLNTRFFGYTAVADGDGTLKAQIAPRDEGIAFGDVVLDPQRKATTLFKGHGRWTVKMPWYAFIWPLTERMGRRAYARNTRRKARARMVSA